MLWLTDWQSLLVVTMIALADSGTKATAPGQTFSRLSPEQAHWHRTMGLPAIGFVTVGLAVLISVILALQLLG